LTALVGAGALLVGGCSSAKKTASTATTAASTGSTAAATGASCGDPANNTASAPGITKDTVHLGVITSATGNAASTFSDTGDGANARIQAQNAKGGVCGRKLVLDVADDASTPAGDLTASQSAVETKHAFAVIGYSPYQFGGIRYLQSAGVPVVGGGFDGPEWHQQPYTNMFPTLATDPTKEAYTVLGQFFKKIGATNVAGLAYGASPSSTASIKQMKSSVEAAGLKMGYMNLTVPFGGVDFGGYVLAMKQAGIDGAACSCVDSSNFAMFTALKQAGVNAKGLAFSGPTSSAFANPSATDAAQGEYFQSAQTPVIVDTPAIAEYKKNLTQYVPAYKGGFPTFGLSGGYISADLVIQGLIDAGQNPTRASYMAALRSTEHSYDAHGLLATPIDFALDKFTSIPDTACTYYVQVKGNEYILPFDKICGTKIPGSAPGS
jgi:branched-chain amino acid transport system substrate-binding protein